MSSNLCPACEVKFSSEKIPKESTAMPNVLNTSFQQKEEVRPIRTSTPVTTYENIPTISSADSVTDFFYQSWKSGLHSNDSQAHQRVYEQHLNQPFYTPTAPLYYAPPVVYVNTVIFQPFVPVQHVGYRSDGTFGVLSEYWPYNSN